MMTDNLHCLRAVEDLQTHFSVACAIHTDARSAVQAAAAAAAAAVATRYSNSDTVLCTMIRVNAFARFSSMFTLGVAWPLGAADSAHTSTQ